MLKRILPLIIFLVLSACIAFAQAGRTVTLQWDPNTEPDINHYNVYYGTASGSYGLPVNVGNVTQWSFVLPTDDEYFFVVTAVDDSTLESDYSNEVNTAKPTAPGIRIVVTVDVIN